uniref:putative methyltransferase DDB_G0268948 n=1 Tax=Doryrhamphus excisus TaxID=161450 RepID=UPI0025ADB56A|nr:putative methyltransferase DDB_G0268948 [Doryrhamphus excisus]XP_057938286.1 putative methyltransferase DDB_G0268948 [Doryrhamphus excisus]
MAHRLFEGKEHAACYWKYRICPSDDLIKYVIDFVGKQKGGPLELAVDVGCGSGQGTVQLAKYFASVVGTDISPAQLHVALEHAKEPNITYRQCMAEELPFADGSVDLITAMSAFHWFDRPRFLQEVHRVLKPHGCLALLNYTIQMELSYAGCCLQSLNQVCKELYATLDPYRSPHLGANSIELYREAYTCLPYTNKEWNDCVWVKRPMPLSSYIGLVESFSNYQAMLRDDPQKAMRLSQDVCQRLMSVMKVTSAETEVMVGVRYFYILAENDLS